MVAQGAVLDGTFRALGDPTRRALVERLARGGEATVGQLAAPLPMSQPAVTKHLGELESTGLVTREKRGRTTVVTLEVTAMAAAAAWIARWQNHWEAVLDGLETALGPPVAVDGLRHDPALGDAETSTGVGAPSPEHPAPVDSPVAADTDATDDPED